MDPATQMALVAGVIGAVMAIIAMANAALMFWLNMMKERRLDERAAETERRADDREKTKVQATELVAQKVDEVKLIAEKAAAHAEVVARNTSGQTIQAIEEQTGELKEAIQNGGSGVLVSGQHPQVVEAPVTVVAPKPKESKS